MSYLRALPVLVVLGAAACGDEGGASGSGIGIEASTRLADLLDRAAILSPLTDITAVADITGLENAARELVFEADFEKGGRPGGTIVRGTRSKFLAADLELKRWRIPAEPNAHYLFERSADFSFKNRATATDLVVYEGAALGDGTAQPDRSEAAEMRALKRWNLRMHRPGVEADAAGWERGQVAFFTTPRTRFLEIGLGSRVPRTAPTEGGAFDDVRVWRIKPTPAQTIALRKAEDLATWRGDASVHPLDDLHGIYKRGQFPPIGDATTERGPALDSFSHVDALYAPGNTEIAFPVQLEGHAKLRFSICLSSQTAPGDAAHFEILARTDGREEILWQDTLAAEPGQWHWHEQSPIDLTAWRGRSFDLVLRTRPERGHPHPLWGNPTLTVPPEEGAPRNVILIAIDTLRADRLSSYGYGRPTSPHIDALAKDGTLFDQVASNATWTCPSFASILTGTVVGRHKVWDWGFRTPLPRRLRTLAERFRGQGWSTHAILYKTPLYNAGFEQGFDVAFNVPGTNAKADDNLAKAMEWLESHADQRNFLFLHFDDPHQPFNQPGPFDSQFGKSASQNGLKMPLLLEDIEPEQRGKPAIRQLMRNLYDGEIAYVDDRIGAFITALKKRGLYDDAVIALVSDHGEQLWEHGRFGHGSDMLYDEVVRVPMIVKPPAKGGTWARDKVMPAQVMTFDVMPTLLELAGLGAEDVPDAVSLTPHLKEKASEVKDRVAVIDAWSHRAMAARTIRWKYVIRFGRPGTIETLFDLQRDKKETTDVAAAHADELHRMRLRVLDYAMTHHAGSYFVVLGDKTERTYSISLDCLGSIEKALSKTATLGGLPARFNGANALIAEGEVKGPIVAAWKVGRVGSVMLDRTVKGLDPRVYRAGDLEHLIAENATGPFLFECQATSDNPSADQLSEDLEQIEKMRVLGYTGNNRPPPNKK